MVGDHQISERVYRRLKADLLGSARTSDRLNINVLAELYKASTTPVREALLRLVGEGIVEMPASGGFALPCIDAATARDEYELGRALALMAAGHVAADLLPLALDGGSSRLRFPIDALLVHMATRTGNKAIVRAIIESNDHLHPIRVMEEMRLPNLGVELETVHRSMEKNNTAKVRSDLNKYYRRRLQNIPRILGLSW